MDHERWLRRQLEIAYWRLVNMKAERAKLERELAEARQLVAAWDVILAPYGGIPADEEPST